MWEEARHPQFGRLQNIEDLRMHSTVGSSGDDGKHVSLFNCLEY